MALHPVVLGLLPFKGWKTLNTTDDQGAPVIQGRCNRPLELMRGFLSLLAIGGGALIFMGRQIPLTLMDYDALPGGHIAIGSVIVLLGLWIVVRGED